VLRWCVPPAIRLLISALSVPLLAGDRLPIAAIEGGTRTSDALLPDSVAGSSRFFSRQPARSWRFTSQ
jgi:hypothetical protein